MVNTSALVRVAKPSYNAQSSTGMERHEYGGFGPYLGATNARLAWSVDTAQKGLWHTMAMARRASDLVSPVHFFREQWCQQCLCTESS